MPQLATHLNSCLLSERTLGASSPTVGTAFHLFAFFLAASQMKRGKAREPQCVEQTAFSLDPQIGSPDSELHGKMHCIHERRGAQ